MMILFIKTGSQGSPVLTKENALLVANNYLDISQQEIDETYNISVHDFGDEWVVQYSLKSNQDMESNKFKIGGGIAVSIKKNNSKKVKRVLMK